jgi:hypothetical protein
MARLSKVGVARKRKGRSHAFFHAAERVINKVTVPVMILLGCLIAAEFLWDLSAYQAWITAIDWFILLFFIVDLVFKYLHTKGTLKFVKLYWLEIIAVFPFYLLFRFFVDIGIIGETVAGVQRVGHEVALAQETQVLSQEAQVLRETRLLQEVQLSEEETRFVPRIILFVQDSFRVVMARLGLARESMVQHAETHRH